MGSYEKYYSIEQGQIANAYRRVMNALYNEVDPKPELLEEDMKALGRMLAWKEQTGDDGGQYEHVVDFLWMSWRITDGQKLALLALVGE